MNFKRNEATDMRKAELSYLLNNMLTRGQFIDYADLEYEAAVHATNAEYSKSMDAQVQTKNLIQRL
jgi:hypothetical protein|nr:MAG TPA: hypothetical protein [Caudoviricetes sp.]